MAELASALGVSARTVTSYRHAQYEPSDQMVMRLAEVLGFPFAFFFGPTLDEPTIDGASFRALKNITAKQRDRALAAGALALTLSDWIESRFKLPEPNLPKLLARLDPQAAAMSVRAEWGLGERPIRSMLHVLEAHGVRVFSLTEDLAVDAYSFWRHGTPYVFLNTLKSAERSRMDAAHELGHLVLHSRGDVRGQQAEHDAAVFASAFLMPAGSVLAGVPRGARLDHIVGAKRRWGVAAAALAFRMHRLGLLTDWEYRMVFTEIGRLGYRTSEPNGVQREASQILMKVFKATREDRITMTDVARDLAITTDELSSMLFGLTFTVVTGAGRDADPGGRSTPEQLGLQLL
jgi:Zn-dependent peptidase ImmA (M78 family)